MQRIENINYYSIYSTKMNPTKLIISRTDSIGDVLLTLPMCVWLKATFPAITIVFLGRAYTKAVVDRFEVVDEFIDWNTFSKLPSAQKAEVFRELQADVILHVFPSKEIASLAKKAKIPMRIGSARRAYHLLTCTHRLNFTRKKSTLHEAQLNFELLKPFGLLEIPSLQEVTEMTRSFVVAPVALPAFIQTQLDSATKSVILHPKSQGSALEWPIEKYFLVASELAERGYTVFFTGTETEGKQFTGSIPIHERIVDTTGVLTLEQLIYFISKVHNLVACSTGPLHLAGFTGIRAIGLFSPRKPIHPGRWQALGKNVSILVHDPACPTCAKNKSCTCIQQISVERVMAEIN